MSLSSDRIVCINHELYLYIGNVCVGLGTHGYSRADRTDSSDFGKA